MPSAPRFTGQIDVELGGRGGSAILHLIRFDAAGRLVSPRAAESIVQTAGGGDVDRVAILSHGWNNSFDDAVDLYRQWMRVAAAAGGVDRAVRTLWVGVLWPAVAISSDAETGPVIASASGSRNRQGFGLESGNADSGALAAPATADWWLPDDTPPSMEEIVSVAVDLPPGEVSRLVELARQPELDNDQASELAGLIGELAPAVPPGESPPGGRPPIEDWGVVEFQPPGISTPPRPGVPGELFGDNAAAGSGLETAPLSASSLETAGWTPSFWNRVPRPGRWAIRKASVWRMKDRAGLVGWHGVGPLVSRLTAAAEIPIQLIGHSFGSRVVLTAARGVLENALNVAAGDRRLGPASILLLQPAVNALCFATDVGDGRAGGFAQIAQSIGHRGLSSLVVTHSQNDDALSDYFHWMVARDKDIGEISVAADALSASEVARRPPRFHGDYAALGGYGPRGPLPVDCQSLRLPQSGTIELPGGMVSVNADAAIAGHNDVAGEAVGRLIAGQWAIQS